jgi:ABC-2 type transport system ATP-binding protein
VIEVRGLTKRYGGHEAVSDISFKVEKGEIVGFLGPNGAGKSTTLRMITGFVAPTSGSVWIDGIEVGARPVEARRRFGYMPEIVPLYEEMRVLEFLRYRAELKGVGFRKAKREAERALEVAGVSDVTERIIGQLSKGYRQRVGLADALLGDPPLLILDEPTAGLDPNQIRHVRELVTRLAGEKTIFLSTHILPEVEATCGRVVIIRKGKKVGEGVPTTLRDRAEGGVTLFLAGPAEPAAYVEAITGLSCVKHAAVDARERAARLVVVEGDDSLDSVFQAVVGKGLALRRFESRAVSLEEVFVELTQVEEGAS